MFFYSNPVNACLPSASVDGHFLFPYFENCGDNNLLCGNKKINVVTMW